MSSPQHVFWRNRCTVKARTEVSIDATTLLPAYDTPTVSLLEDEPCDLTVRRKRVVERNEAGVSVTYVPETILRLHPESEDLVPDANDHVTVDGKLYRVVSVEEVNHDPPTGAFLGAVLLVTGPLKIP